MEKTSRKGSSDDSLRRARAGRASARAPFPERQRSRREAARRRVAARTRTALTPEQRAVDPIAHRVRTPGGRAGVVLLAAIASVGVHLGAIGVGVVLRANLAGRTTREDVVIEMRQPPPPPPPEQKPPPPPEPPPPVEKPARQKPVAKVEPPPSTPQPPPKAPPVRVVGLSLESTSGEGDGPAFAVGNTRLGETEKKAVEPKDVTPPPTGTSTLPAAGTGRSNQVARHIPVDGVTYTKAQRKAAERKPPFPETLKSQGIEGDVPVLVTIDARGKVTKVKILKESPYPEFNAAARAFALSDDFEPATRDGVPMETTLTYTVKFRLEDGQ